jgi:hypothetical protein
VASLTAAQERLESRLARCHKYHDMLKANQRLLSDGLMKELIGLIDMASQNNVPVANEACFGANKLVGVPCPLFVLICNFFFLFH